MMSFEEKSRQSFTAAEMLYKSNLYPSTINRSYYGFFQFMMHILFKKMGQDQQAFLNQVNSGTKKTHSLVLNIVGTEFVKKIPKGVSRHEWLREYQWLTEKVQQFKKIRNEADYLETKIESDDASKWMGNASSMITVLNKAFK